MLDSFLTAGGAAAVLRVLRESSCPLTLSCTVYLIRQLLDKDPPERPGLCQAFADELHESGGCGVLGPCEACRAGEVHADSYLDILSELQKDLRCMYTIYSA